MSAHFGEPQGARLPGPRAGSSTTPILFPSGEDANPLNRRLPAEVVTRQRRVDKKPVQEKPTEEVQVDLRTVLALRPDARQKWLSRAFKMAEEGKAAHTDLYDILSSRKFAAGIPGKVGRKLFATVIDHCDIFSDKQQRFLRSDEWVMAKFSSDKADDGADKLDDKDDDVDEPVVEPPPREPAPEISREKERGLDRQKEVQRANKLAGAFEPLDGKDSKGQWTTQERQDVRAREKAQEAAKRAKREGLADLDPLEMMQNSATHRQMQQQQAQKKRAEEEADSSLDLLERLNQQKRQKHREPSPEPIKTRRTAERDRDRDRGDRDRDRDRGRKRGMSRSRSVSVASPSPKAKRGRSGSRGRTKKKSKGNLDDLIRQRMAERDREIDSARIPVVDPGHAQRWK